MWIIVDRYMFRLEFIYQFLWQFNIGYLVIQNFNKKTPTSTHIKLPLNYIISNKKIIEIGWIDIELSSIHYSVHIQDPYGCLMDAIVRTGINWNGKKHGKR